jgi:hypothetical protein
MTTPVQDQSTIDGHSISRYTKDQQRALQHTRACATTVVRTAPPRGVARSWIACALTFAPSARCCASCRCRSSDRAAHRCNRMQTMKRVAYAPLWASRRSMGIGDGERTLRNAAQSFRLHMHTLVRLCSLYTSRSLRAERAHTFLHRRDNMMVGEATWKQG